MTYTIFDNFLPNTITTPTTSITANNTQNVATFTYDAITPANFVKGLQVSGELELNGESIDTRLRRIEERLHIPHRNVKLEEKYEHLKKIYQDYENTIAEIKTWEILKGSA
jgi:hypothetical protein